jgi:hypothetical protein
MLLHNNTCKGYASADYGPDEQKQKLVFVAFEKRPDLGAALKMDHGRPAGLDKGCPDRPKGKYSKNCS